LTFFFTTKAVKQKKLWSEAGVCIDSIFLAQPRKTLVPSGVKDVEGTIILFQIFQKPCPTAVKNLIGVNSQMFSSCLHAMPELACNRELRGRERSINKRRFFFPP